MVFAVRVTGRVTNNPQPGWSHKVVLPGDQDPLVISGDARSTILVLLARSGDDGRRRARNF